MKEKKTPRKIDVLTYRRRFPMEREENAVTFLFFFKAR